MNIIAYFEGEYNLHRGKFLNSIVRYKKNILKGVYSQKPTASLIEYLAKQQIKLFTNLQNIPSDCSELVISLLDFDAWDIIYADVKSMLDFCVQKNMKLVNGTFKYISNRFPQYVSHIWDIRKHDSDYQPDYLIDKLRFKTEQLRILTVGTDSNIGKMTAALDLEQSLVEKKIDAKFIATGQIGIFLTGDGVALDSTVIDFSRGILEGHLLKYPNPVLIVEGQGSIFHPVFFGTATTLILTVAPQLMIMCGKLHQKTIRTAPHWPIPDFATAIAKTEALAKTVCAEARVAALTLNTAALSEQDALNEMELLENQLNLPVTDIVRFKSNKIVGCIEQELSQKLSLT